MADSPRRFPPRWRADKVHGGFNFDNINESFFVAVGTPDQIVEQLEEWGEWLGTNHFNIQGAVGNMPHWKVVKNLNFFGQDIIPRMRARAATRDLPVVVLTALEADQENQS